MVRPTATAPAPQPPSLLEQFVGADAYSFVFDGQLGYLDHALANDAMLSQVNGVTTWNINADEISLLDYNDDLRDANEASFERESSALDIYHPDQYRSSDHDPVIVGLDLVDPATLCNGLAATIIGTDGRDRLTGTRGDDVIIALGGNDFVNGRGGDDVICGGDGGDVIIGGLGADAVFGQGGNDRINGNFGDDRLDGGEGDDRLNGNAGRDELDGGAGDDQLRGGFGDDVLDGGPDVDRLWGSFGTDTCVNGEDNRSCEL